MLKRSKMELKKKAGVGVLPKSLTCLLQDQAAEAGRLHSLRPQALNDDLSLHPGSEVLSADRVELAVLAETQIDSKSEHIIGCQQNNPLWRYSALQV